MSVIKHKEQRVGVFIDTQNLYHCAKNLYHAKVNFGKVVEEALAGRSLIRAVAYVITTESGDEKGFFDALAKVGIEAKTKDLQIFAGGAKKADWDLGLAEVDLPKETTSTWQPWLVFKYSTRGTKSPSPKLDCVILISGDGDFVPLVEYLKTNQGCQVEVVSFGKSTSAKLIESADDFTDLDNNPKKYLIGGNRG